MILVFLNGTVFAVESYRDVYVNDFGGIFSEVQISELKSLFSFVAENTSAQMVVVTSNLCNGAPSSYAQEIFDFWKIGQAEKDNGLLILYCVVENKIWVQTGYGLEGILPDSKLGRMLDDYYVPLRDSGNVSEGIISVSKELSKVVLENKDEVFGKSFEGDLFYFIPFFLIFFLLIFFLLWIFSKFAVIRCLQDRLPMKYVGKEGKYHVYRCPRGHIRKILISSVVMAGGFSRSSFGVGRSGGFGGGFSGGGGAGR